MKRVLFLLAVAGFLAVAAACGDGEEEITIGGENGEVKVRTGGELSEDFPDDFPVFDDADLIGTIEAEQEGIAGLIVTWETDASAQDVTDFYEKALEKDPWESQGVITTDGQTLIGFARVGRADSGGAVTIVEDGRTQISVFLSEGAGPGPGGEAEEGAVAPEEEVAPPEEEQPSGAVELPEETELPSDYPRDIAPLPDGARVIQSASVTSDGETTFTITYLTEDGPESVADFYDAEVPGDGWSQVGRFSLDGSVDLSYQNEDETGFLVINISESEEFDGYTEVLLLLTTQE